MFRRLFLLLCLTAPASAALPEPPQQHAPWQPVSFAGIPDELIEVVPALFDSGLADPRGGEYRTVELSETPGYPAAVTTHAWYFAGGFAVGWDGVVHRVAHAGAPADLRADVSAAKPAFLRVSGFPPPLQADLLPVVLLLRLNQPLLAQAVFTRLTSPTEFPLNLPVLDDRGLTALQYLERTGTAWLSAAYHQAIEAHAAGKDQLTIELADVLERGRTIFMDSWRTLGPPARPNDPLPDRFLDPVSDLRSDSERRLKEPAPPPFDAVRYRNMPSAARIQVLIARLEDIDERQFSYPGGVWLTGSPVCKLLAEDLPQAVEPLIDVMDSDRRLTRSYSAGRPWFNERHPIAVSEAAEAILQEYYGLPLFRWHDPAVRKAWLLRNRDRSLAERALELLADDSADELQWLDAAQILLKPVNRTAAVVGDGVRERRNPSVSELLEKRVIQSRSNWGGNLAMLLYRWEPAASLRALQQVTRTGYRGSFEGRILGTRMRLGDAAAGEAWASMVKSGTGFDLEALAPMWIVPENKTVIATTAALFDEGGPLAVANVLKTGRSSDGWVRSPLLLSGSFRGAVLQALEDAEALTTLQPAPGGGASVRIGGVEMGFGGCPGGRCRCSGTPASQVVRVKDWVASRLSQIDGFPCFDLTASLTDRDRSAAEIAVFLRDHAGDLRTPDFMSELYFRAEVSLAYGAGR
jgi:hypothetical protein